MNSIYITSSGVRTMLYQFLAFFFHKFDLYAVFTIDLKTDNLDRLSIATKIVTTFAVAQAILRTTYDV